MRLRYLAVALAALLLASSSMAAAKENPAVGRLEAQSLETFGPTEISGELRLLNVLGTGQRPDAPLGPFTLEAKEMVVEEWSRGGEWSVVVFPLQPSSEGVVPLQPKSEVMAFRDARAVSGQVDRLPHMFLVPSGEKLPKISLRSSGGSMAISDEPTKYDRGPMSNGWGPVDLNLVSRADKMSADVSDSLRWRTSTLDFDSELVIEGDFSFTLWSWDLKVTDDSGRTKDYDTGMNRDGVVYIPTDDDVRVVDRRFEERQIYVHVTDAVLRAPWFHPNITTAYLDHVGSVQVDGLVNLRGADGELASPTGMRAVAANSLKIQGALTIEPTLLRGEIMRLILNGRLDAAASDGYPIPWASTAQFPVGGSAASRWWIGTAALVGAPTLVTGGYLVRKRRLTHLMTELEVDMELESYDTVVQRADRLLRVPRFAADVAVMKTVSLIRLGRLPEARSFLESASVWSGPEATRNYLFAYLHALEESWAEASKHLVDCLDDSPDFCSEVISNPAFTPLLQDPVVRSKLPGATSAAAVEGYI